MFDRIGAKEKAKTLLRKRSLGDAAGLLVILVLLGGVAGILVVPILLSALSMGMVTAVAENLVYSWDVLDILFGVYRSLGLVTVLLAGLAGAAGMAASLLYHVGMIRATLRYNRGDEHVRVVDILLAGDRLGKAVCITLWQALLRFVWSLPSIVPHFLAALCMGVYAASGGDKKWALVLAIVLFLVAMGWAIFISVVKTCQYYFAYHISEEQRELSARDCIKESSALTAGHKRQLFVTMLTFLGWDILGTTIIGNALVSPYKYLTYSSIYEQLTGGFRPVPRGEMPWMYNRPVSGGQASAAPAHVPQSGVVEILSGELAGSQFSLNSGEEITVGRDPNQANVVVSGNSISGLHCSIRYDGTSGMYAVTDHSTNGTYINNEKLSAGKGTRARRGAMVKLADGAVLIRLS